METKVPWPVISLATIGVEFIAIVVGYFTGWINFGI